MELAELIDDSTFCTMNDEAPTRVMGTCNSSPDITIASGGLINSITWQPMLTLASDHLPIIISNEKPPDFVSVGNRTFFTVHFIPAGRIAEIRPNIPAALANKRDTLRHADPGDPPLKDLNLEIRRMVNQHKRTKCIEHLKSCNLSTGVSKLWDTVKALSNPKRHDDRVEVQFNAHSVINAQIVCGLNQKPPCERTILVALDLSKAFDTLNHTTPLQDIEKTTLLPSGLKRWTMNYLNGRQSSVLFRCETSELRRIKLK
ncbi:uncharacterized protein LOC126764152, partial [Bactrocera neohumeralis]|uniref:uncharacterized protein LOC126764152 n=1 Tax=Bactrocera neohumeralis TaxID=98809 RepID=UPI002166298F